MLKKTSRSDKHSTDSIRVHKQSIILNLVSYSLYSEEIITLFNATDVQAATSRPTWLVSKVVQASDL